jgi:bla regulator protein BlaR1
MDFSTVKLFPDNLIKALCDTLIHSLWQGLLLAAVTGLIIVFTRRSTPAKRYNLLIAALVLFAAGTLCTFIIELSKAPVHRTTPTAYNIKALNFTPVKFIPQAPVKLSVPNTILKYLNNNAATIVLIWFMIVCARCLQLITGLQGIYYLRRKNIFKVDARWENRVKQLTQQLGIARMVKIAESGLAKVPMVIGHIKPVILIPVGLLTAMPTDEIEAILVHELAHIRRSDYLINLLQSLMEIIFFFNPAVLWISALIKTERENCCDDIAIAQSSSKVNYIKALVSCQEYDAASPAYAMALKGTKTHLKDRVTRIISNNNHSLNRVEKSLLAICLVTAGLFTAAFTNSGKINKLVSTTTKAVTNVIKKHTEIKSAITGFKEQTITKPDTLTQRKLTIFKPSDFEDGTMLRMPNKGFATYLLKEKGILYQLNYKGKALNTVQVKGKTLPADELPQYQKQINHVISQFANGPAEPKAPAEPQQLGTLNRLDSADSKLSRSTARLGKLNAANEQKDAAIADSVNKAYKKTATVYANSGYYKQSITAQSAKSALPAKPAGPASPAPMAGPAMPVTPPHPVAAPPYPKVNDDKRRDQVINEMINDGIIKTRDNLSFKISTNEFIVNGKKQPDDVYQKYRAKYVKITNGEWSWMYNYDTDAKRETNKVTEKN